MGTITIATYFDSGYLPRAVALFDSLSSTESLNFEVLALDHSSEQAASRFTHTRVTQIDKFLEREGHVANSIEGLNKAERIFATGPSFLLEVMSRVTEGDWLIYCDADLIFYKDIDEYMSLFEDSSVVIVPHNHYPWNRKRLAKYGEYNVGLVAFRNDQDGREVLEFWAKSCLEWCRDFPDSGRYADQKYLERFPVLTSKVSVDRRVGANLAPWNSSFKKLRRNGAEILVNEQPLFFFHMQGLRRCKSGWMLGHLAYGGLANSTQRDLLYVPYLQSLERNASRLGLSSQGSARTAPTFMSRFFFGATQFATAILGQRVAFSRLEGKSS